MRRFNGRAWHVARREGRGREASAKSTGLRWVLGVVAKFMFGRPDRIVALPEVDRP